MDKNLDISHVDTSAQGVQIPNFNYSNQLSAAAADMQIWHLGSDYTLQRLSTLVCGIH